MDELVPNSKHDKRTWGSSSLLSSELKLKITVSSESGYRLWLVDESASFIWTIKILNSDFS